MLCRNRAGRLVELNDKEAAKRIAAKEMTAVEVAPKPAIVKEKQKSLDEFTDEDLKLLAKKRGIKGFGNMKRETLLKNLTS